MAGETGEAADGTVRQRLLRAALEVAAVHGIARLSIGDVARAAGLSRQTLYKHFANKQALVAEVVADEARAMIDAVVAAADAQPEPRAALEAGMLAALRLTRDHPLLDRLVRTEPESLIPLLVAESSAALLLVRHAVTAVLAERFPALGEVDLRRLADMVARLLVSYAVSAPDDPPEVVAAAAAGFLVDGVANLTSPVVSMSSDPGSRTGSR